MCYHVQLHTFLSFVIWNGNCASFWREMTFNNFWWALQSLLRTLWEMRRFFKVWDMNCFLTDDSKIPFAKNVVRSLREVTSLSSHRHWKISTEIQPVTLKKVRKFLLPFSKCRKFRRFSIVHISSSIKCISSKIQKSIIMILAGVKLRFYPHLWSASRWSI